MRLELANPLLFHVLLLGSFLVLALPASKAATRPLDRFFTDELRGIAILGIVLHHLSVHVLKDPWQLPLFQPFGTIGVALFLMLSGYGLSISWLEKGGSAFWSRRIPAILLPAAFCLLLWRGLALATGTAPPTEGFLIPFAGWGWHQLDRNYWYLPVLFLWYLAFDLSRKESTASRTVSRPVIWGMALATALIAPPGSAWTIFAFPLGVEAALRRKSLVEFLETAPNWKTLCWVPGLLLTGWGLYLASIEGIGSNRIKIALFGAALAGLSFFALFAAKRRSRLESGWILLLTPMIAGLAFHGAGIGSMSGIGGLASRIGGSASSVLFAAGIGLAWFLLRRQRARPLLGWIGGISFEIYLIHGALMYSFDPLLHRGPLEWTFWPWFAIVFLLAFAMRSGFAWILGRSRQ